LAAYDFSLGPKWGLYIGIPTELSEGEIAETGNYSGQYKRRVFAEIFDFSLNFRSEFGVYNINDRSYKGRILEMGPVWQQFLED
jgi:hypothetical protein